LKAIALCCLLVALASVSVRAEVIDRVLAVAAGEVITLSDVMAARDLGLESSGSSPDPIGVVLSKLIDRELVLAEVDRYAPPEPTADAVDHDLEVVRARFPSLDAYASALAASGIDELHLRRILRENLRIQAYESQRFTVPPPSDEELAQYYRAHPQDFTRDGKLAPLEAVRPQVTQVLVSERRTTMIEDWVSGLRRRADVLDLYLPGR
jgi:hypothetical protein